MTSPALYSLASVVTVTSHAALFGSAGIRISASCWSSTCAMTAGAPASCSAAGSATCVGAEALPVAGKASGGSAVSIDARDGQCGRVPFRGRGRHSSYDATSHFESVANNVLSLYKSITGEELDMSISADTTDADS